MLNPFLAGERLTAARLVAAFDIRRERYQESDQTVNNSTTLVSSNFLTLSVAANAGYLYEASLFYDTNATADFKHNVLLPSGATVRHATLTPNTSIAATNGTISMDVLDAATFNSGGVSGGTKMSLHPRGIIATAGTAGSVTIQFAQATANASNTILAVGSWFRLTRVL